MSDAQLIEQQATRRRPGTPWLDRLAAGIEQILETMNFVVLLAMIVVVASGVIARYVFNSAFSWSEEFAIWGFTWLIFIGAVIGLRQHKHVAVDLVVDLLAPAWRARVLFLRDALVPLPSLHSPSAASVSPRWSAG